MNTKLEKVVNCLTIGMVLATCVLMVYCGIIQKFTLTLRVALVGYVICYLILMILSVKAGTLDGLIETFSSASKSLHKVLFKKQATKFGDLPIATFIMVVLSIVVFATIYFLTSTYDAIFMLLYFWLVSFFFYALVSVGHFKNKNKEKNLINKGDTKAL